jgi:hypothetical protein
VLRLLLHSLQENGWQQKEQKHMVIIMLPNQAIASTPLAPRPSGEAHGEAIGIVV